MTILKVLAGYFPRNSCDFNHISSTMIKWPVEETGANSVIPSTNPKINALSKSIQSMSILPAFYNKVCPESTRTLIYTKRLQPFGREWLQPLYLFSRFCFDSRCDRFFPLHHFQNLPRRFRMLEQFCQYRRNILARNGVIH